MSAGRAFLTRFYLDIFPSSDHHQNHHLIVKIIIMMMMMVAMATAMAIAMAMMRMMMTAKGSLWNICSLLFAIFLFLPSLQPAATFSLISFIAFKHLYLLHLMFWRDENFNFKFIKNYCFHCFWRFKQRWWWWCKWFARFQMVSNGFKWFQIVLNDFKLF